MDRSVNPKNHDGLYTLHGGNFGYDQRNWTVTAYTSSSVTFALYDNAAEGFPGDIVTHTTYTVDSKRTADNPQGSPRLVTELVSLALTESTPIMLSNHIYWNLNAFKQPTILDDTWLQLPLSRRFIETDSNQIPTGVIAAVEDSDHSSMDFTVGKTIGQDIPYTEGLCGPGCIGYDHCFIIDRDPLYAAANVNLVPALRWHSSTIGISMEVATNQPSIRVFTCLNMDGTVPVKPSQVERNGKDKEAAEFVEKYGCLAIEPEGWMILSTILNGARTLSTLPGTFQPLTTPLTLSVLSEAVGFRLRQFQPLQMIIRGLKYCGRVMCVYFCFTPAGGMDLNWLCLNAGLIFCALNRSSVEYRNLCSRQMSLVSVNTRFYAKGTLR
jgi:galactose mutarotase-like enzyme